MTKKFTIERYIQKCTPPSVLILIMASELLKLIEWFKISIYIYIYIYTYIYIYISRKEHDVSLTRENF